MCYFKLHRAYSNSFSSSNVCKFFWSWILKRLYQSLEKEKESRCIVFTSSTKRKIRQFHVAVVQLRQRNVQKSVMHVQSCCFANLNLWVLVCGSRCRRRRRCLSFLIVVKKEREGEIRDPSSRLHPVERLDYGSMNNVCSEFYSNGVFLINLLLLPTYRPVLFYSTDKKSTPWTCLKTTWRRIWQEYLIPVNTRKSFRLPGVNYFVIFDYTIKRPMQSVSASHKGYS